MTDSAPSEDASPPDPVARPATSRSAKLLGQIKRFRGPLRSHSSGFWQRLSRIMACSRVRRAARRLAVSQDGIEIANTHLSPEDYAKVTRVWPSPRRIHANKLILLASPRGSVTIPTIVAYTLAKVA